MPVDGLSWSERERRAVTDSVIRSFGEPVTRSALLGMAEEMERRIHIHPGGWVRGAQVARELQRRAIQFAR